VNSAAINMDVQAETLKQEAKKRRGLGTREKVSWRRINLESNTYAHGSKTRNLPI
jgi:hypothetical protein